MGVPGGGKGKRAFSSSEDRTPSGGLTEGRGELPEKENRPRKGTVRTRRNADGKGTKASGVKGGNSRWRRTRSADDALAPEKERRHLYAAEESGSARKEGPCALWHATFSPPGAGGREEGEGEALDIPAKGEIKDLEGG